MAKKNAYFFSHDCNARLDEKMLAVRMKHGVEGYGVYFMLIERLTEAADHMSAKDYNAIAFDFRCNADLVQSVVEDFGLFCFTDNNLFFSESLLRRMEALDNIREKRRAAGRKGGISKAKKRQSVANANENCSTCQNLPPEIVAEERKEKDTTKVVSKEETKVSSKSSSNEEDMSVGKPPDAEIAAGDRIDYEKLIAFWNEKTKCKWGKLTTIENNRRKMLRARIAEHGKTALITAIEKAAASDFLAGAPWFNFDWMIRPNNFDKIISGNYDNKATPNGTTTTDHSRGVTKPTGDYAADF